MTNSLKFHETLSLNSFRVLLNLKLYYCPILKSSQTYKAMNSVKLVIHHLSTSCHHELMRTDDFICKLTNCFTSSFCKLNPRKKM